MARWGAKFDVDCPSCDRQTLAREADVLDKLFLPAELRPYALAVCQSCRQALLLLSGAPAPDVDPEDLPARPAPVLWPVVGRAPAAGLPAVVGEELAHARAGLRAGSTASAVVHVRRVLEAVCADHGVRGRTLFHALRELRRRELIDGWLLEWAEELRELGNEAAHLGGPPLAREEARDAVELAEAFVDYLYVFARKYRDFQVRRGAPAKGGIVIPETPVMRRLRKYRISFMVHPYSHDPARTKSRAMIADELGIAPGRMLKAVIVHLGEHPVVAIAPIEAEIDEKALADVFGAPQARVADLAALRRIRDTLAADVVSPLALPYLPSVLDAGVGAAGTVHVASGRHGFELELTPADLVQVTSARTARIVKIAN